MVLPFNVPHHVTLCWRAVKSFSRVSTSQVTVRPYLDTYNDRCPTTSCGGYLGSPAQILNLIDQPLNINLKDLPLQPISTPLKPQNASSTTVSSPPLPLPRHPTQFPSRPREMLQPRLRRQLR
jgi:hypothetical protein